MLLDMQYRMHPLIAEYPSALFYKGKLKTGISAEERPLPSGLCASVSSRQQHNYQMPAKILTNDPGHYPGLVPSRCLK